MSEQLGIELGALQTDLACDWNEYGAEYVYGRVQALSPADLYALVMVNVGAQAARLTV
jgi:hypothetical protein